jgi:hypothetical protein
MRLPVTTIVYRLLLPPELAAELRERIGTEQRGAQIECESAFSPSPDARVLRIEPDEPVAVLVDNDWPVQL